MYNIKNTSESMPVLPHRPMVAYITFAGPRRTGDITGTSKSHSREMAKMDTVNNDNQKAWGGQAKPTRKYPIQFQA